MKNLKKIIFIAALFIMAYVPSASAYEVVGQAVMSDIVCYINNFPITSYNFNGSTYVQVEDLSNYGFDVKWNEYNHTLRIMRSKNNELNYAYAFKFKPEQSGTPLYNFVKCDVKTYIGDYGYEIPSYSTADGKTFTCMDNLSPFGRLTWSAENRTLNLWIEDGLTMNKEPQYVPYFQACNTTEYCECAYFNWYSTNVYGFDDKAWILFSLYNTTGDEITEVCNCSGNLRINVIDSWGQSVYKKTYYLKGSDTRIVNDSYNAYLSMFAYFHGLTDVPYSYFITIDKNKFHSDYNKDGNVLIKYHYHCSLCDEDFTFEEKVNIAPIESTNM